MPPIAQKPARVHPMAWACAFWLAPVAPSAGVRIWLAVVQRVPDLVRISAAKPPALSV